MGRISNLSSKRKRNQRERRRKKRGLIIGSAVVLFALACYVGNAYLRYCTDRALLASIGGNTAGVVYTATEEVSFADYLMPLRTDPAATTLYTIQGKEVAVREYGGSHYGINGVDPGNVTPSSISVAKGGTVTLKATPNAGFVFTKWAKKVNGVYQDVSTNSVLTISNVEADETYEAWFTMTMIRVEYICDPQTGGYINNMPEYVPMKGNGNVVFPTYEVVANPGYGTATDPPVEYGNVQGTDNTVVDYTKPVTVTAKFVKSNAKITITGVPSGILAFSMGDGTNGYDSSFYSGELVTGQTLTVKFRYRNEDGLAIKGIIDADNGNLVQEPDHGMTGPNEDSHNTVYKTYVVKFDVPSNPQDLNLIILMNQACTSSVSTFASPAEGGITSGDAFSTKDSTLQTTINATPNRGYMFDHWEHKFNGNIEIITQQQLQVSVSGHHIFTACFVDDAYEVKGHCDPENGGSIEGTGKYKTHSDATLTAKPSDGYQFDKWTWKTEDGIEHESKDNTVLLTDITEDYLVTAHFSKANPHVSVTVSPIGASGSLFNYVRLTDGNSTLVTDATTGSATVVVKNGSAVTMQAFPNTDEDYVFACWVDQDGNSSSDNPHVSGNITDDISYVAVFARKQDKYALKGISDPEDGGTFSFVITNPDSTSENFTGSGYVVPHASADVTATPNPGYLFDKWTWRTRDGVDHDSREDTLHITNILEDYTLTGHFVKENSTITVKVNPIGEKDGKYNYAEISDTDGHSTSTDSGGTGSVVVTGDSVVTLRAIPNKDAKYQFSYWVDEDGNVSSANPYVIGKAEKDTTYTAIFTSKDDDDITVLASPPSGGKVTCKKTDAGGYTISASANRGYTFQYWKCADTGVIIKSKTYTMDAAEGANHYTYIAYFKGDKDARFTSDLTHEYFPNIRRLFKDPNYKYTRSSWATSVSAFINSIRGNYPKASGTPSNLAAFASAEEAMNEKAAQYAPPKITAQSELITTDNEIIPVTDHADTDTAMERALAITEEKFGDRYTPEIICVKDVSAPNGFIDGVRTYLWYDTGVEKNDNLFIIYEMNGQERIVTPIADHKGTLRFTIDKLGSMNRFALVRVTVE